MEIVASQYGAQMKTSGGQPGNKNAEKRDLQSEGVVSRSRGTAGEIAKQNGMSTVYVERAVRFSRGLNSAESVSPGFKDAVLSGEVKAPEISGLSNKYAIRPVEAPASDVSALAVFLYS